MVDNILNDLISKPPTIKEENELFKSTLDLISNFTRNSIASTSTLPDPKFKLDSEPFSSLLYPPIQEKKQTGIEWLRLSLENRNNQNNNNYNNNVLLNQILEILKSPSGDDDIANSLLEIWGYEEFDNVGESIRRRNEIISSEELEIEEIEDDVVSSNQLNGQTSSSNHRSNYRPSVQSSLVASGASRTPQAQIVFQTSAEIQAMKKARKLGRHNKGKGRDEDQDGNEVDLEEWERIREESLALGPGNLVSGNRVSVYFFLSKFTSVEV